MPLLSFVASTFVKIPKNGERINLRKNKIWQCFQFKKTYFTFSNTFIFNTINT